MSSFAWGLVNFIIPLESFATIFQQLAYLATNDDRFSGFELVIALVDAITIFPPAKGLKAFTGPLKAMTVLFRSVNPKFMDYFGSAIGRVMTKAKEGKFDTLWNLLPFLVLGAQLYIDEESREGLKFLIIGGGEEPLLHRLLPVQPSFMGQHLECPAGIALSLAEPAQIAQQMRCIDRRFGEIRL